MNQLRDFGNTAKDLARNPLGIIALFIVLIYGFASLVVAFSNSIEATDRQPLIWFLVLFPMAVLGVFSWLVSQHHNKLYAPRDYRDDLSFLQSHNPDLKRLPIATKSLPEALSADIVDESLDSSAGRAKHRQDVYGKNRGFFLVHSYEPSTKEGQDHEIFIYVLRHKSDDFSDIARTEFFLGQYWGNKVFDGEKTGNIIGIQTSAYGPFLCTCRLTFEDGEQVMLDRYIDFSMAPIVDDIE